MSKEEILSELEKDIQKSANDKGGEYFYEDAKKRLKKLVILDRPGVMEALRYWLCLRSQDLTMIAVWLTRDLMIKELKPDLENLKEDIKAGKVFKPYYIEMIDRALKTLNENT